MKSSRPNQIESFVAYTSIGKKPYHFQAQANSLIHPLLKATLQTWLDCQVSVEELEHKGNLVYLHHGIPLSFEPIKVFSVDVKGAGFYAEIYTEEQYHLIQKERNKFYESW